MKNEKLSRAYQRGFNAAIASFISETPAKTHLNPYLDKALRSEWSRGWLKGCDESRQSRERLAKSDPNAEGY